MHSDNRIDELEKQVAELARRVSELEAERDTRDTDPDLDDPSCSP